MRRAGAVVRQPREEKKKESEGLRPGGALALRRSDLLPRFIFLRFINTIMRVLSRTSARRAACLLLFACFAGVAAQAGPRYSESGYGQVAIRTDANGGYAEGALGVIRNSSNATEYISCTVSRTEVLNSSGVVVRYVSGISCTAVDASGQRVSCTANDPMLLDAFVGVSSESVIGFEFDTRAVCTDVVVYESSTLDRKQ